MRIRSTALLLLTCGVALGASAQAPPRAQPAPYPQQPSQPPPDAEPYAPVAGDHSQPPAAAAPQGSFDSPPSAYAPGPGYPSAYMVPARTEVSSVAGAWQLSLVTNLVSYTSASLEFEADGSEVDVSGIAWGLVDNSSGIEIAYGVSDRLLVGGRLTLGGASETQEAAGFAEDESSTFAVLIAPKLEYMFSPASRINPFVGGLLGVSLASTEAGPEEASQTSFVVMARAGLRCFLADGFSLDPALAFAYAVGGGSFALDGGDADFDVNEFVVALSLGVSGWLR